MQVKVIKGYVSYGRRLYGVGSLLDMEDGEAGRLVQKGVVEAVDGKKPPRKETQAQEKEPAPEASAEGVALPTADPVAAVKRKQK